MDYAALRLKNIERNNEIMESIMHDVLGKEDEKGNGEGNKKRKRNEKNEVEVEKRIMTRSSKENTLVMLPDSLDDIDERDSIIAGSDSEEDRAKRRKRRINLKVKEASVNKKKETTTQKSTSKSNKVKDNVVAEISKLTNSGEWIGRVFLPSDGSGMGFKEMVMKEISGNKNLTFSRMSGIQAFKNAICLFVNVDGEEYPNQFQWVDKTKSSLRMTWFAQATQTKDSETIIRMMNHVENGTFILLFLRRKNDSYICCGDIDIVLSLCNLDSRPIKFTWYLKNYNLLKANEAFKEIVSESIEEI